MAQEFGNVGVRSEDNNENLTECPDRVDAKKMLFKWNANFVENKRNYLHKT